MRTTRHCETPHTGHQREPKKKQQKMEMPLSDAHPDTSFPASFFSKWASATQFGYTYSNSPKTSTLDASRSWHFSIFFYSQMHQKTIRKAEWFIVVEWNAIHKCFFHSNLSLIVLKPLQKMCLKEPFDISMIKNIMQLNNPIILLYVIWAGPWVTTSFNPDKRLLLTEGCHSARCLR